MAVFDQETAQLLRAAPKLAGVDPETLPQRITRTYTRIVELRVRAASGAALPEDLADELEDIRRMALAYEAIAATSENRADARSAAFVAASAYQLLGAIEAMLGDDDVVALSTHRVSGALAATVLFLAAGYFADAREAFRRVQIEAHDGARLAILRGIFRLVSPGAPPTIESQVVENSSAQAHAVELLWRRIDAGISALRARLVGENAAIDPEATFLEVEQLARLASTPSDGARYVSVFAGPHHLAVLLRLVTRRLLDASLIRQPPPSGVDGKLWSQFVTQIAKDRPYLWENHQEALRRGYLNVGTSAVISLPTGAGKSTLSELKIGSALLAGRKVVFLVPTQALIHQVTDTLSRLFPGRVGKSLVTDGYYAEVDPELPDVIVLTPERCLTLLGAEAKAFEAVGLIVFDECHLMHGGDRPSRRSVDAMLAFLLLLDNAAGADVVLMSAMMANHDDVAAWVAEAIGRPVIPLAMTWKPTRQARGCVVYPSEQLKEGRSDPKSAPTVTPHGLFCLQQTWVSNDQVDYHLVRLLDDRVPLNLNKWSKPTPNGNHVAGRLARALATANVKTLVFVQNRGHCASVARTAAEEATSRPALTNEEQELFAIAVDEVGSEDAVFIPDGNAAVHHGLLIAPERRLNERLFERPDGLGVLVATPTLAQGMNLPAEAVILVGDERHDETGMVSLEAHELLNAAGRAGRAGLVAQALVIMIPSRVVEFDASSSTLSKKWFDLKDIFGQADQCLQIVDPLTAVLDQISQGGALDEAARYLLLRLPGADTGDTARRVLGRSLAAFHAKRRSQERQFSARVDAALIARGKLDAGATEDRASWQEALASRFGVPTVVVTTVEQLFTTGKLGPTSSVVDLSTAMLSFFAADPGWWKWFAAEVRLGDDDRGLGWEQLLEHQHAQLVVKAVLAWMAGASLVEIETHLAPARSLTKKGKVRKPNQHLDDARKFVLRCIPSIAYYVGLATAVRREQIAQRVAGASMPIALATLGACVREGVASPELLALRYVFGGSRKKTAARRESLDDNLQTPPTSFHAILDAARALKEAM